MGGIESVTFSTTLIFGWFEIVTWLSDVATIYRPTARWSITGATPYSNERTYKIFAICNPLAKYAKLHINPPCGI